MFLFQSHCVRRLSRGQLGARPPRYWIHLARRHVCSPLIYCRVNLTGFFISDTLLDGLDTAPVCRARGQLVRHLSCVVFEWSITAGCVHDGRQIVVPHHNIRSTDSHQRCCDTTCGQLVVGASKCRCVTDLVPLKDCC